MTSENSIYDLKKIVKVGEKKLKITGVHTYLAHCYKIEINSKLKKKETRSKSSHSFKYVNTAKLSRQLNSIWTKMNLVDKIRVHLGNYTVLFYTQI